MLDDFFGCIAVLLEVFSVRLVAVFASEGLGGAGFGEGVTMSGQLATRGCSCCDRRLERRNPRDLQLASALGGGLANDDEITEGLDLSYHGERDYNFWDTVKKEERP